MEIVDVVNHTPEVSASELVRVTFIVKGGAKPFIFPFSNESLEKGMLHFITLDKK